MLAFFFKSVFVVAMDWIALMDPSFKHILPPLQNSSEFHFDSQGIFHLQISPEMAFMSTGVSEYVPPVLDSELAGKRQKTLQSYMYSLRGRTKEPILETGQNHQ